MAVNRLFISGIPEGKSKEEIIDEVRKYTEGACDVSIVDFFPDHVFVSYVSPEAAKVAKKALRRKKLFDVKIKVKLAHPEIRFNDDNEVAPDVGDSALAGTSSSDQTPAVVDDGGGNPIICSICGYRKKENDHKKFMKTRCGHVYCKPCMNYKFRKDNPEKPRLCNVCNEKINQTYNRPLTGHVLVDD